MKWILAIAAMGFMACGGDDDDDGGDGGAGNDGPAVNCVARCEAKLNECGQGQAAAGCPQIVCGSATESQLTCIEGSTCDAITAAVASGMSLCGVGEDGAGGGGGGCPTLSGCACGISGVVEINGRCAMSCDEACAALQGAGK